MVPPMNANERDELSSRDSLTSAADFKQVWFAAPRLALRWRKFRAATATRTQL